MSLGRSFVIVPRLNVRASVAISTATLCCACLALVARVRAVEGESGAPSGRGALPGFLFCGVVIATYRYKIKMAKPIKK